jgi:hypothetical protein
MKEENIQSNEVESKQMDTAMLFIQRELLRGPLHITELLRMLLPPNRSCEESDRWRDQQIHSRNTLQMKYSQQTLKIFFVVF